MMFFLNEIQIISICSSSFIVTLVQGNYTWNIIPGKCLPPLFFTLNHSLAKISNGILTEVELTHRISTFNSGIVAGLLTWTLPFTYPKQKSPAVLNRMILPATRCHLLWKGSVQAIWLRRSRWFPSDVRALASYCWNQMSSVSMPSNIGQKKFCTVSLYHPPLLHLR